MKKQCGYLDIRGGFHKSAYECNDANIKYEINRLRQKVKNLVTNYAKIYAKGRKKLLSYDDVSASEFIERIIEEMLVYNHESLLEYKKEKDIIENNIDILYKIYEKPKLLRKDWWLGEKLNITEIYQENN